MHSECLTGDVFHSLRCDCGEQLETALRRIADEGAGVLLYMAQEGRGIGLLNKLKAYELQENGYDTVEANVALGLPIDARDYGVGNQILADLGLTTIRILTNNPKKMAGIDGFKPTVVAQEPIEVDANDENRLPRRQAGEAGHARQAAPPGCALRGTRRRQGMSERELETGVAIRRGAQAPRCPRRSRCPSRRRLGTMPGRACLPAWPRWRLARRLSTRKATSRCRRLQRPAGQSRRRPPRSAWSSAASTAA